jgi:hypothetical protein
VRTSSDHLDLAPDDTREGDKICVLLGSDLPLILRPLPDDEWMIVDACHIHGLMSGEALRLIFLIMSDLSNM